MSLSPTGGSEGTLLSLESTPVNEVISPHSAHGGKVISPGQTGPINVRRSVQALISHHNGGSTKGQRTYIWQFGV